MGGKEVVVLLLVGDSDSEASSEASSEYCNSRGKPAWLLGVWREAVIWRAVIVGLLGLGLGLVMSSEGGGSRSLLIARVHANVSPT